MYLACISEEWVAYQLEARRLDSQQQSNEHSHFYPTLLSHAPGIHKQTEHGLRQYLNATPFLF